MRQGVDTWHFKIQMHCSYPILSSWVFGACNSVPLLGEMAGSQMRTGRRGISFVFYMSVPGTPLLSPSTNLLAWCVLAWHLGVKVDGRTEGVWLGHPRHLVFDNSTDFEAKMARITSAASRIVGLPCRPRKLCKFLLFEPPPPVEEFPVPVKEFHAEKVGEGIEP